MLKKIITHPFKKKCSTIFLVLFSVFYLYHVIRFYFLDVDCDFITGTFNQTIETCLFYISLLAAFLLIIQIVSGIYQRNKKTIFLNATALILILFLLWLFINNTLFECFLHGVNLDGLSLSPGGC